MSKYRDHVTAELEAVIMRCLEKKPADRWQSAEELLPHLETISTPSGGLTPAATMPVPAVGHRNRFLRPAVIVGAVAVLTLGVVGKQILTPTPFAIATSNIRQLTALSGIEYQPDISPDGNDVAYVAGRLGETQLFVQSVAAGTAGNPLALVEDLPGFRVVPEWSQDGQFISFSLCDELSFVCSNREVAKLGGPIRTLFSDTTFIIRSPDSELIAFVRDSSVLVAQPDGSRAEVLAVVEGEGTPHSLAWSPDGSRIAFVKGNRQWVFNGNIAPSSIWVVRVEDGTLVQVTSAGRLHVSPQWMPDSRHLLFVSNRDGPRDIYFVEVGDEGAQWEPQRVTGGGADPHSISISADGSRLAYSKFTLRRNIWSLPISESGPLSTRQATAVTSGNQIVENFSLSPGEDSIAFDSHLRGNQDIYKMPLSGGTPQPLTDDPADDFAPHWSPDGTEIAFYSTRTGDREIWVMDADGSNEMRLTRRPGDDRVPRWSRDGLSIAFSSFSPGTGWSLWIMRREQVGGEWGEPELLSPNCRWASWGSDGTKLSCYNGRGVSLIASDGELLRQLDPPLGSLVSFGGAQFAPGDSLLYVGGIDADGGYGLWLVPLSGADPIELVADDDPDRRLFSNWGGSRYMYFTLGEYESDIWVMDLEW